MKMKNKVVYRHLKPNGEVFYVGIGDKERPYKKVGRNKHWKNIVNKYSYEVQILKSNLSWEEATELECLLIDYYGRKDLGTGPLVNLTDGGEGVINLSDESREKMSKAHTGKFVSEETRDRMSKAQKGKKLSDETKLKMSEAHTGKFMSEESKIKMSEAKKGRKRSEETKAKISEAKKGHKLSEEHKAKLGKTIICTETGNIWYTVGSCAIDNGLNKSTLTKYLNGSKKNKTTFKYI